MNRNKGFTLIELLVVIAIIALLLAILVPSLQKAKLAVEEVYCRSNLKQYGLAGKLYLEDYNSKFPNAWDSIFKSRDEAGHPRVCQWHDIEKHPDRRPDLAGSLWPYLGSGDVHVCRTLSHFSKSGDPHPGHDPAVPIEPLFCYSMNAFLGGFEGGNHRLFVGLSQIRTPARVFFFAEENGWEFVPDLPGGIRRYSATLNDNALCGAPGHPENSGSWAYSLGMEPPYLDAFGSFHKTTVQKRNDGMANAVFIDNHVDLVDPTRTYYYTKPMNVQPPLR